jgi:ProP effector
MNAQIAAIKADVVKLTTLYPRTFFQLGIHRRPIKVGINLDLLAVDTGMTLQQLGRALAWYVGSPGYLANMKVGAARIDLAGETAGAVTPEDEAHAAERIAKLEAKWKAQRQDSGSNAAETAGEMQEQEQEQAQRTRPLTRC